MNTINYKLMTMDPASLSHSRIPLSSTSSPHYASQIDFSLDKTEIKHDFSSVSRMRINTLKAPELDDLSISAVEASLEEINFYLNKFKFPIVNDSYSNIPEILNKVLYSYDLLSTSRDEDKQAWKRAETNLLERIDQLQSELA